MELNKENDWMDKLKEGNSGGSAGNPPGFFTGVFKFKIGDKVLSRIHECEGIIEYAEFTRFIKEDQISYKIRFNDPEVFKTEASMVDEPWLDKI